MLGFKDSVYWKIYSDIWNFHKLYAFTPKDSERWEDIADAAEEIRKKYENRPEREFVVQLLFSVIEELERDGG